MRSALCDATWARRTRPIRREPGAWSRGSGDPDRPLRARRSLAALAAGGLFLSAVPTAAAAARLAAQAATARPAARFLPALLRGPVARARVRVRNGGGAALAHALLAKALVLLVVLDAGSVIFGHGGAPFLSWV